MKPPLFLVLAFSLLSFDAQAISRYSPQNMACGRVKEILSTEGAVILTWRSKRDLPLYDRFVTHAGWCENTEITKATVVPTNDSAFCLVLRCIPKGHDPN
ncbi:hypothetical protein AB4144_06395 [Rhizobiaceae sp. 2RAB30]